MIKITTASHYVRKRRELAASDVSDTVRRIIADVQERGDRALRDYALKFDGIELGALEVTAEEISHAVSTVGDKYIDMLKRSAKNIREFHSRQLHEGFMFTPREGVILGQRVIPLQRVGLYVPGGTASYPSSVLMNAIPAKIAGCEDIIVTTPRPSAEILAAAKVAGVTRIFRTGGAQAVAAMAYGTESIPRVDKITGPGNAYVAEAKRQVFGHVAIDMIAGPSEILIIADKNNFPAHLAADMLAQAEHDINASAILITNSKRLALSVNSEIEVQLPKLERRDIARSSIDNNGAIIIVRNLHEAIDLANDIAPEHLEICLDDPFKWMTGIRNAGSIFIGRHSPEALGDYYAGANHTLPTMGTARFSSPLSVDDFVKRTQYIYYSEAELYRASGDIEKFAMSEGLTGHARSISVRREG
ncbi:MAG: histidinol dehydrogenase [Synergistaceae bacterium]|nr:histidinol dehydrogenase [Synergistaceae bacterium]